MGGAGAKQAPNPFKGLKPEDLDMQDGKVIVKGDPSKASRLLRLFGSNLFATLFGKTAVWLCGTNEARRWIP